MPLLIVLDMRLNRLVKCIQGCMTLARVVSQFTTGSVVSVNTQAKMQTAAAASTTEACYTTQHARTHARARRCFSSNDKLHPSSPTTTRIERTYLQ